MKISQERHFQTSRKMTVVNQQQISFSEIHNQDPEEKQAGSGVLGLRKDLTESLWPSEPLKRQRAVQEKEAVICPFSLDPPGLGLVRKEG